MTPKKTAIEGEREAIKRAMADSLITGAARIMVEREGVPIAMMIDRLMTFAAAQACAVDGQRATAEGFRKMADRIDDGLFSEMCREISARRNMQ